MESKKYSMILFVSLVMAGCDAVQKADGVIIDKDSKIPLDSVAIGKEAKEDPSNSFTRRAYSEKHGSFHYHSIGMTNDVELYFSKDGYKTIKIEYTSSNRPDTIRLEREFK